MMVNGKILLAVSPAPFGASSGDIYTTPTSFYEYDYVANSFAQVSVPGGGTNFAGPTFPTLMLDLPDGTVFFGHRSFDFYEYKPAGLPLPAGQPVITSITTNGDGSLHLIGTGFNGLSQGSAYGDDEQMDSNYPLVRFIDASGNVRYGRTYNWSSTSVMTGNDVVTTECAIPPGASASDIIQVVVNGIASSAGGSTVTTTSDGGPGSLRQLISILPSGSTINFSNNLSGQAITLTSGELELGNTLMIDASALLQGIQLNGNGQSRIFNLSGSASVLLNGLTLTNAYAGTNNWGGAIENAGTLVLTNCTLTGNFVDLDDSGGAVHSHASMTAVGCTFAGNTAGYGGAIENTANCSFENCTFSGNTAKLNGGGVDNNAGVLSIMQCTFSGNIAATTSSGGAGGAMDNYLGTTAITNSILAGNIATFGNGVDIYNWAGSTIIIGGTDVIPKYVNKGTNSGPGTILTADPSLEPLGNYGGPTQTMPPSPGSVAIDAGSDAAAAGITTDQRGYPRLSGVHVDIGAVEVQIASTPPALGNAQVSGGMFGFNFTSLAGGSFTVFASTNLAAPFNQWLNLGVAIENPVGSGQFEFSDTNIADQPQLFYKVRSP
jgi:hypothetical protein